MNKTSTILQSSTAVMGRRDSISQPVQSRSAFCKIPKKLLVSLDSFSELCQAAAR
jgi:hypothetical protein